MEKYELDEFLMFDLRSISSDIDDHELQAYAVAMTISAMCGSISESLLKMYLSSCYFDSRQLDIHFAIFSGMDLLTIHCDCGDSDNECIVAGLDNHYGQRLGKQFLANQTMEYLDAKDRVVALRNDLLG